MARQTLTTSTALVLASVFALPCAAQWSDNFDSYKANSSIDGQGGWQSADAFFGGFVVEDLSLSPPHSLQPTTVADLARPVSATSGRWTLTAWHFLPSFGLVGPTHFKVANVFVSPVQATFGVRLTFSPDDFVTDAFRPDVSLPIVFDKWIEIRVEIDLDRNLVDTYYNGEPLSSGIWTINGGAVAIAAAAIENDGAFTFYDDFALAPVVNVIGDTNGDGVVDVDDLIAVILSWGACKVCADCPADVNDNCAVDVDDLITVILNWG